MDKLFKELISSTVKPEAITLIKILKLKHHLKNMDKELIFFIRRLEAQILIKMLKLKHLLKNMEIIMVKSWCSFLFDIFIYIQKYLKLYYLIYRILFNLLQLFISINIYIYNRL